MFHPLLPISPSWFLDDDFFPPKHGFQLKNRFIEKQEPQIAEILESLTLDDKDKVEQLRVARPLIFHSDVHHYDPRYYGEENGALLQQV